MVIVLPIANKMAYYNFATLYHKSLLAVPCCRTYEQIGG